ncbi:ABC transporter ATP-binding protein [Spiroplasma gladiatoris]|uniref:ABC transporter ATP-binding protein n=1 Tax=Spiroplasma gladiatoris TaxID=2143 RepID=A0A4V1AQ85_9MOLU|nr:ABC transporter transmembrane domain-containing protein [Spiroplasma gladiatoris]QBQ07619.1 ABC transporter ATP-binding protein [Spiroplasma gladiatoris]
MKNFTKKVWLNYFFYTIITFISNCFYLGMSYAFSYILDYAISNQMTKFYITSSIAISLILLHLLLDYISQLILNSSIALLNSNLRKIVAKNTFVENYKLKIDTGEFLNLNFNKVNQVADQYYKNIFDITKTILTVVSGFGFLTYLSWISFLATLVLTLLVLVMPLIMNKDNQKK